MINFGTGDVMNDEHETCFRYSIVIPVYNEEMNLIPLHANIVNVMQALDAPYEIIMVEDGSKDGSRWNIEMLMKTDPHIVGIFFNKNYGQTAALDAGFKAAKGEIIITMDADLQVDAGDIPGLLPYLNVFDAVMGYRKIRKDNLAKRISSKIANRFRNKITHESIRDTGCPLKIMKRETLKNIKLYDGMHRFFPTLIKLEGYRIIELPVNHYPRKFGVSKYNIANRLFKGLRDLFVIRWMKRYALHYKIEEDPMQNLAGRKS